VRQGLEDEGDVRRVHGSKPFVQFGEVLPVLEVFEKITPRPS
jgi:hypothetical protein